MIYNPSKELSLADIFVEIRTRGFRYSAIALLLFVPVVLWAFLSTPIYRSEGTITVESNPGQYSSNSLSLGGLASLAGLSLGDQSHREEIIATLKARGTAVDFIANEGIAPILMRARWNQSTRSWQPRSGSEPINAARAYEVWQKKVLNVADDRQTGLVTVAVDWYDPKTAADWDAQFLKFTDSRLRADALREAEASINFLQTQLALTRDVGMQRSIADLLEQQTMTETLAKVRTWYALHVVDPPAVPITKFKPNRLLMLLLGAILAGVAVVLCAISARLLGSAEQPYRPSARGPEVLDEHEA